MKKLFLSVGVHSGLRIFWYSQATGRPRLIFATPFAMKEDECFHAGPQLFGSGVGGAFFTLRP
jgi:hypothetical protein